MILDRQKDTIDFFEISIGIEPSYAAPLNLFILFDIQIKKNDKTLEHEKIRQKIKKLIYDWKKFMDDIYKMRHSQYY